MPGRGCPPALRQQSQVIVKPRCQTPDAKSFDARRGELDRERNPVQPSADFGDPRSVRIAQLEFAQRCRRALYKELNRREPQRLLRRDPEGCSGGREWHQAVDALSLDAQRFAAGCEDI